MRDHGRATRSGGKVSSPAPGSLPPALVRSLGRQDYEAVWQQMRRFTAARDAETADEFWFVEHPPIYTLGVAAKPEHLPRVANGIPVVKSDRGGQITYHGPGQVVAYTLLDLRRRGMGVRTLVRKLERAVIELVADYRIDARGRDDAPGVYVGNAKIAALGLRVRDGRCYHGLSLNVDMDLSPFAAINPCGYPGLEVTQLRNLGITDSPEAVAGNLAQRLAAVL